MKSFDADYKLVCKLYSNIHNEMIKIVKSNIIIFIVGCMIVVGMHEFTPWSLS